jgi:hypothetical protein
VVVEVVDILPDDDLEDKGCGMKAKVPVAVFDVVVVTV